MFTSLALAVGQLPERDMRQPLLQTLFWSILLFAGLWLGVGVALRQWLGHNREIAWLVGLLGALAAPLVTWLLFPSVAIAILGFYSESIIRAVERRHYPDLPAPQPSRLAGRLWAGIRLACISLLVNILALPLYLLIPGANLILFLALNGYVLGREYFDTVALRRMEDRAARLLWRSHRMAFIVAGAAAAGLFMLPVVNLVAPIVGTATAVHLIERLKRER